jgi:hypothetical protein
MHGMGDLTRLSLMHAICLFFCLFPLDFFPGWWNMFIHSVHRVRVCVKENPNAILLLFKLKQNMPNLYKETTDTVHVCWFNLDPEKSTLTAISNVWFWLSEGGLIVIPCAELAGEEEGTRHSFLRLVSFSLPALSRVERDDLSTCRQ